MHYARSPPGSGAFVVVPRQTTGHPEKVAAGPFGVASLSGGFLAGLSEGGLSIVPSAVDGSGNGQVNGHG
jgi:hypothetical protein